MNWRDDYFPIAARETSACPFCPEDIHPGDAITQRRPGEPCCHIGCAYEQDDTEENEQRERAEAAAIRKGFRRRVYRSHHGRRRALAGLRPLKRKQRVKV